MPAPERLGKLQWLNHVVAHRPEHPDWTPTTLAVAAVIFNDGDQYGEGSFPGDERIARVLGCKVRAVAKHRAILVQLGMIERTARANPKAGRAAVWRLRPPTEWVRSWGQIEHPGKRIVPDATDSAEDDGTDWEDLPATSPAPAEALGSLFQRARMYMR